MKAVAGDIVSAWPLWWLDLPLLLLAAEALVLLTLRRRGRALFAPRDWLFSLLAGGALLLTLRGVLAGAGTPLVLACLAAGGLCHALDLRQRLHHRRA